MEKTKIIETAILAFGVIMFAIVIALIVSYPVMMLWNYCLVGAISGVNQIGWMQAFGIMMLCAFLFKNVSTKAGS